jgi:hypothetical protein
MVRGEIMKCAKCGKEITEREAYLHIWYEYKKPDFENMEVLDFSIYLPENDEEWRKQRVTKHADKVCFECLGELMKEDCVKKGVIECS